MLNYFISILLFCGLMSFSQKENDSISKPTQKYGLRVGADLYRATKPLYNKNYSGFEISGDYRISHSHYLAIELGSENNLVDDDLIHFTTKGNYTKIGFDYNAYRNWLDMQNMIYVGLRYGYSNFSQTLQQYSLYNNNTYFPSYTVATNQEFNDLSAHWIEFVAGIKTEILNNLYLGFSVRLKRMINQEKPDNFDNLYIPGFNRTREGSHFGSGFNYTISYLIPIVKK